MLGRTDYPTRLVAIRAVMAYALTGGEALWLGLVRLLVGRGIAAEPVPGCSSRERMAGRSEAWSGPPVTAGGRVGGGESA